MSTEVISDSGSKVTPSFLKDAIRLSFATKQPIMIWGAPGIGKSDIVDATSHEVENTLLIDIRLTLWSETDLKGFPRYCSETNTMVWASPGELPSKELASKYARIVIFLDELPQASPSVQAAAYQLILGRRIGQYELPDNVYIIAAGNRDVDRGLFHKMPPALSSRFMHYELQVSFDDFRAWAIDTGFSPIVLAYLQWSKESLFQYVPKKSGLTFGVPRTWSMVSKIMLSGLTNEKVIRNACQAAVGDGSASAFLQFRKDSESLPNPEDVLSGLVTLPDNLELSLQHAMSISMLHELNQCRRKNDPDILMKTRLFIKNIHKSFTVELIVSSIQLALVRYDIEVPDCEELEEIVSKYGHLIFPNN